MSQHVNEKGETFLANLGCRPLNWDASIGFRYAERKKSECGWAELENGLFEKQLDCDSVKRI